MAYVITNNQHYINIANAIRDNSFGNIEGPLSVTELPQRIREISTIGQAEGRMEGYAQGLEEGKQAGAQSEYDRFWDTYQAKGKRSGYMFAFAGNGWTDETFLPKYDLELYGNCGQVFQATGIVDLYELTIGRGLKFNVSNLSYASSMFAYASVKRIPPLNFEGITGVGNCFESCKVVTIDKITIDERFAFEVSTFRHCGRLENLTIEGVIAKNGLNLSWSPLLTHDSLMSIINALQDKTGDTGASWAVTLGADNLAKLTDAEKAIATQRGWTLA